MKDTNKTIRMLSDQIDLSACAMNSLFILINACKCITKLILISRIYLRSVHISHVRDEKKNIRSGRVKRTHFENDELKLARKRKCVYAIARASERTSLIDIGTRIWRAWCAPVCSSIRETKKIQFIIYKCSI